jgi:NAD+ synthase (glutamine-hydrolysing)
MFMQIALAQINCTVGDLDGNARRILAAADAARAQGASLIVTPELALSGYPPEDLVLRGAFNRACAVKLRELADSLKGITAIVGYPLEEGGLIYNAAAVLQRGKITHTYRKYRLPNYSVFDEERYFEPRNEPCVFDHEGVRIGINICEDVWLPGTARTARDAGAELLIVLNASPYHIDKQTIRHQVLRDRVAECRLPIIYTDMVGGQDELVFDGASFAMNRSGEIVLQLEEFKDQVACVEYNADDLFKATISPERSVEASVYDALCLGVKDYIGKNGFPGVLLGLSGGIDSALTLCIAVDALGADKVHAVMMPSQYTAGMSLEDAQSMADGLGVKYSVIPIKPVFDSFLATLAPEFKGTRIDTTEENLQARIRGTLLMALSNKFGSIVLTTGNKSEMAVGYSTLYGDMAGGFAVIKDISKTLVYRLCRYRNGIGAVIPERVIVRPPSAELRPDQKDQDSLPAYEILDAIMEAYMERNRSPQEIIDQGFSRADVERVVRLIKRNEYKRRQAPIGVRITERGFGKDWRYPITSKYQDI